MLITVKTCKGREHNIFLGPYYKYRIKGNHIFVRFPSGLRARGILTDEQRDQLTNQKSEIDWQPVLEWLGTPLTPEEQAAADEREREYEEMFGRRS